MPLDYSNPSVIKFLKENYEREKDQRVRWFLANKETLVAHATITEKNKGYRCDDVRIEPLEICMPMITAHHKVSAVNRLKKLPRDGPVLTTAHSKGTDVSDSKQLISTPDIMKPVEPYITAIMYEEMPKGGRNQYLKARKCKFPDENYYFCQTSANVIGWQWKDSAFQPRPPRYGKHQTLLHETSRSGPQPEPKHYKQLIDQGSNKCSK